MTIQSKLDDDYKAAMRSKDSERVSCIRQLKAKVQEATNAKDFSGEVDDALYAKTIAAYAKSLQKAIDEMAGGGDRAQDLTAKYQAEIDYLSGFLPKRLSEDETAALVKQIIRDKGLTQKKQMGQLMGAVMQTHKDSVDAAIVKRIAESILA